MVTIKSKRQTIKTLTKKLDKIFSEYVRRRDSKDGIVRCCTCGEHHHWKQIQCGHFISRRYMSTRFDEKNTGPQCAACNMFNQGRQFEMGIYLNDRWGDGTAQKMFEKSKMLCKRDRYDLECLISEYKQKLNEL